MVSRPQSKLVFLLPVMLLAGCSDDSDPPCEDPGLIGVPLCPVCVDEFCTDGAGCSSVVEVHDQAELAAALGSAPAPGTCLALAAGAYGDIDPLPAGVSLLGRWADEVTVGAVRVDGGSGAMLRGFTAAGIVLSSAQDVHIEAVRAAGGARGIDATGSSFAISRSELTGSQEDALLGVDVVGASVQSSYIHDAGGPGIWLQCARGCDCAAFPDVMLERVHVENTRRVGVNLIGVAATIQSVDVLDTTESGGGMAISGCSTFNVEGLTVQRPASFGVLIDSSSGGLGSPATDRGIIIIDGRIGIWLQNTPDGQTTTLQNFDFTDNAGVGIGIGAAAKGIIIIDGRVSNTYTVAMPVDLGGQQDVGDGLVWNTDAEVQVSNVMFSGSGRNAMLIDGSVDPDSSLADITLTGGDEALGIIQQQFTAGDNAPTVGANVPPLQQDPTQLFAVPLEPTTPAPL